MKWPRELTLVTPGETELDLFQENLAADPDFLELMEEIERNPDSLSVETLAKSIKEKFEMEGGLNDFNSGLTEDVGFSQAEKTGAILAETIDLPEKILVAPCIMSRQTLEGMTDGWPELKNVNVSEDERLRPQNMGIAHLYPCWEIFAILNPEQRDLMDALGPYHFCYPQGESMIEVRERTRGATGALVRDHGGNRILIICPARIVLALQANFETFSSEEEFVKFWLEKKNGFCAVTFYTNPHPGKRGKERLRLEFNNRQLW